MKSKHLRQVSILQIHSLKLAIMIGKEAKERKKAQDIYFDIKINFTTSNLAGKKKSFVCYQDICDRIKKYTKQKKFILIESLAQEIISDLKKYLSSNVLLQIRVHKARPPIKELVGGVSYIYGDLF